MSDYELKMFILKNNVYDEYLSFKREFAFAYFQDDYDVKEIGYDLADIKEQAFLDKYGKDIFRVCHNLDVSRWRKKSKIKKRIDRMLEMGTCLFLTFTFNNFTLNNSSSESRRRRVKYFLKKYSNYFIANIDFGEKDKYFDKFGTERIGTHREHYHAILLADSVNLNFWFKKGYGNLDVQKIKCDNVSQEKISKYVTKLSYHSIKSSTSFKRVIYGGGFRNA